MKDCASSQLQPVFFPNLTFYGLPLEVVHVEGDSCFKGDAMEEKAFHKIDMCLTAWEIKRTGSREECEGVERTECGDKS